MQITPESFIEINKGVNDCFFELENMCQHVKSEVEKCPNIKCDLYQPLNPIQNNRLLRK